MYTSWCGSRLVVTSVPSGSIVSPSCYVQWGTTPLLRASLKGHAEVTRFLLESGSSVQEQNNVGWPKGASAKCPVVISCYFCYSFCLSNKILNHTECKVWPSALINLIKANWSWTVTAHWRVNNNLSHVLYIGLCISKLWHAAYNSGVLNRHAWRAVGNSCMYLVAHWQLVSLLLCCHQSSWRPSVP